MAGGGGGGGVLKKAGKETGSLFDLQEHIIYEEAASKVLKLELFRL